MQPSPLLPSPRMRGFRPGEALLLRLSRNPGTPDYAASDAYADEAEDPLLPLRVRFPGFSDLVREKRVLDFGCGSGGQAIALAELEDCRVCGLDLNPLTLDQARKRAEARSFAPGRLEFRERAGPEMWGSFDVVISKDAMEHYPDPGFTLEEMRRLLKPHGRVLITFGPPWFAPYGSHMHFFCKVPWINLLFAEKTVMAVRGRFRRDGATRYEDCESGLNRMSVTKAERLVAASGFRVLYRRYECIKGLNFLSRLPGLRELFINHLTLVLAVGKERGPLGQSGASV